MSHAGDDDYEVGVASGNTPNKKVYDSLPFALGEDISSHDTSIIERTLYDFPFYNRSKLTEKTGYVKVLLEVEFEYFCIAEIANLDSVFLLCKFQFFCADYGQSG